MKNRFLLSVIINILLLPVCKEDLYAQSKPSQQRMIVIMMDGFGEAYYRQASMPFLNQIEKEGICKVVPSLVPVVTNVNNMSIATGTTPAQNGITGNVYFEEATQRKCI